MAEPPARVSWPLLARAYPQAWRSMWEWALISRSAQAAVRSIIRAKPAVMNGEPRSLTKTKDDAGFARQSRCRLGNRKLWVAGQSFGLPHIPGRMTSLNDGYALSPAVVRGSTSWSRGASQLEDLPADNRSSMHAV
jgi:hypothetical protein